MCGANLDRAIRRLQQSIRAFYWLSGLTIVFSMTMLVLVNFPGVSKSLIADKIQGNLITALFGALSLPSFNEVQKRKDRIESLQIAKENYQTATAQDSTTRPGKKALEEAERNCQKAIEDALKG